MELSVAGVVGAGTFAVVGGAQDPRPATAVAAAAERRKSRRVVIDTGVLGSRTLSLPARTDTICSSSQSASTAGGHMKRFHLIVIVFATVVACKQSPTTDVAAARRSI